MAENEIRQIASDVTVISIALLAVAFILIATSWKGFEKRFLQLDADERKELLNRCFASVIPTLIIFAVMTWVGVNLPSNQFYSSMTLVFLGFCAIAIIFLIATGIRRLIQVKRQITKRMKLDETTTLYFICVMFIAISILCCLIAILGSISSALEINFGADQTKSFLEARWLLLDAITFFISGTLGTGVAFIVETGHKIKGEIKDPK